MKKHLMLASAIACACTLSGSSAGAQSHETVTTTGPNRELLHGGILALGVPYVASVVVAATSDRPEDKHLYIPVAGPWMDLANRSGCGNAGEPSCDKEASPFPADC
jgi:hypothetical protein